ncbi:MAG TPA: hypothetical protein VM597_17145, partial [Gemmataceae bacterium]|nr:hypothetical protein [Gemmataceae bacterium]
MADDPRLPDLADGPPRLSAEAAEAILRGLAGRAADTPNGSAAGPHPAPIPDPARPAAGPSPAAVSADGLRGLLEAIPDALVLV